MRRVRSSPQLTDLISHDIQTREDFRSHCGSPATVAGQWPARVLLIRPGRCRREGPHAQGTTRKGDPPMSSVRRSDGCRTSIGWSRSPIATTWTCSGERDRRRRRGCRACRPSSASSVGSTTKGSAMNRGPGNRLQSRGLHWRGDRPMSAFRGGAPTDSRWAARRHRSAVRGASGVTLAVTS